MPDLLNWYHGSSNKKVNLFLHSDSNCLCLHLIHMKKQRWVSISQEYYYEAHEVAHRQMDGILQSQRWGP